MTTNEDFYLFVLRKYERKLEELMSMEDYKDFAEAVAKEAFRQEVENMADGDFKDFCLENFDMITEGKE